MQNLEQIVEEVKDELINWKVFLNNTIGILSFGFGLGSLGTSTPSRHSWISFIFISLIYFTGRKLFPKTLEGLRKKNKTEVEAILLKGIEKHFFNIRVMATEYIVFVFGIGFLFTIALNIIK